MGIEGVSPGGSSPLCGEGGIDPNSFGWLYLMSEGYVEGFYSDWQLAGSGKMDMNLFVGFICFGRTQELSSRLSKLEAMIRKSGKANVDVMTDLSVITHDINDLRSACDTTQTQENLKNNPAAFKAFGNLLLQTEQHFKQLYLDYT